MAVAPKAVQPYVKPAWRVLNEVGQIRSKRVLVQERARRPCFDVDHGTYPYVTSSNTVAGQAGAGAGVRPLAGGYVLGIVKAYTTRVGEGPFPAELKDETGQRLGERGAEFGTVTGRPRRCGWFDAVLVRQSVTVSGINGVVLTKLDVLDGLERLKICTGYRLGDQVLDYLPAGLREQAAIVPIYEENPRLERLDQGRAVLARPAGGGGGLCPPHRGADRRAGGAGDHRSRPQGHHRDARPVPRLTSRGSVKPVFTPCPP